MTPTGTHIQANIAEKIETTVEAFVSVALAQQLGKKSTALADQLFLDGDASYSQLLVDKILYMMTEDQARLRDCMRQQSLLDSLLERMEASGSSVWFRKNAGVFLRVCDAHGAAASQHHDKLVKKFIDQPAEHLPEQNKKGLTASGPPLPILLQTLEKLRDLRLAADRDDIPNRYKDLKKLRAAVG